MLKSNVIPSQDEDFPGNSGVENPVFPHSKKNKTPDDQIIHVNQ